MDGKAMRDKHTVVSVVPQFIARMGAFIALL